MKTEDMVKLTAALKDGTAIGELVERVDAVLEPLTVELPEPFPDHPKFGRKIPVALAIKLCTEAMAQSALRGIVAALEKTAEEQSDGFALPTSKKPPLLN